MKKPKIATLTLILVLIISALITVFPNANAADSPTFAFLSVAPDPIGVGQTVLVTMWLDRVPPLGPDMWTIPYENYQVEVTKPDGSIESLGPFKSDPVGSQWTQYVVDTIGTYYFQFNYPGQTIGTTNYQPSTSAKVALTIQQEQITYWPAVPLPEGYWNRPISAENREWWRISGNWLQSGCHTSGSAYAKIIGSGGFNPYTTAPNSAHIVWTKEFAFGGLIGGEFGSTAYYTGQSYETKFKPPIIMQGRLYYNEYPDTRGTIGTYPPGFNCVDLRTGETLWWQNATITLGQIYNYDSPNQHGGIPYLWKTGSTWEMYDAFTGYHWCSLENASTGTIVFSPAGDMLIYILNGRNNWLAMWNSSAIPSMLAGTSGTNFWQWRPTFGATYDWRDGIQWNVTVPDVPGSQSISKINDDIILATSTLSTATPLTIVHIGYSPETGQQLWVKNHTLQTNTGLFGGGIGTMWDGVYTEYVQEKMEWYGFDAYTGNQLWGPTEPRENAWGMYAESTLSAYGKLYSAAYDGRIYCYDLNTGNLEWKYYIGSSGFETPYGSWPIFAGNGFTVADGKIFAVTGEHSPSNPIWRGESMHVVDTETGESVWRILGYWQNPIVADGYLVALNGYDNQIYCFGKGQTETTVTGPENVQPLGSKVLIKGTVLDQSPGAEGTPAIADEYMSEWMEYLHMQQVCPDYVEGVEVVLTTLDPNGNMYELSRTTTSESGAFGCEVDPPVPGLYKIIATFEGTESYYGSYDETYLVVEEAPSPAASIEPELASPTPGLAQPAPTAPEPTVTELTEITSTEQTVITETPFITTEIAIFFAVAVTCINGILAFWALRKRK